MNEAGRLETLVAALLRYGSWLASAAISLGFVLALIDSRFATRDLAVLPNMRIATMGIALFIMLPILRVLLMLLVFIREGDFRLAVTAGLVLAIILVGIVLALRATSGIAGQQSPRSAAGYSGEPRNSRLVKLTNTSEFGVLKAECKVEKQRWNSPAAFLKRSSVD